MTSKDLDRTHRRLRVREFLTFTGLAAILVAVLLAGPESNLAARVIATAWGVFALVTGSLRLRAKQPTDQAPDDVDPELERLKAIGYLVAGAVVGVGAWMVAL